MHRHVFIALLGCSLVAASPCGAASGVEPRELALTRPAELPSDEELERAGAVIGEVFVDAQNIFDLNDPKESNELFRLANRAHVRTREGVIRQQLLFRPGERYSARVLAESERLLRSERYLYDASVRPIAWHDGVVDVAVTTRDVWTLNPGVSFGRHGGANTFGFEIEELNILGTGTALSLSRKSGIDRDSTILRYQDPHLAGSWVALDARYASNSDGSVKGLQIDRPFYALDSRWAAGGAVLDDDRIESLYDRGRIVDQFQSHQKFGEAYFGWSDGLEGGWTRRWSVGVTYDERDFAPAPRWTGTSLVPEDRKLVYPWMGFELIQDDFHKLSNRDQIGRTEDFYLGTRFSARVGWSAGAFGADRDALIFRSSLGHGIGRSDHSTLLLTSSFSGRLEDGHLRDALLESAIRYYVRQSKRRLLFITLEASTGRNLDLDHPLLLGGDNGLRGYPLRYQSGTSRALLTVEERYFTDWYPFRLFRVGGAVFFDVGRVWGDTPLSTPRESGVLKDIGVGLRIGNTRSGLGNMIHIDLAMPLDGDSSIDELQISVETKERF